MSRQAVKGLFDQCDVDGNGGLTKVEIKKFLIKINPPNVEVTDDDVATYWMKYNKDHDSVISFDEFFEVFQKRDNKDLTEPELRDEFKKFDKDGSGFIEANEFEVILANMKGYTPEKAAENAKLMDKDGDGKVNFQEFMDNIYKKK